MKLKNTTGEGRKICDGDLCTIVENGEVFEVSDATGAILIAQGFTAIKPPTKSSTTPTEPVDITDDIPDGILPAPEIIEDTSPQRKPHKRGNKK
jgi:hypothetical protein